jgi:transposase-like protein
MGRERQGVTEGLTAENAVQAEVEQYYEVTWVCPHCDEYNYETDYGHEGRDEYQCSDCEETSWIKWRY